MSSGKHAEIAGFQMEFLALTASTNTLALECGEDARVFVADVQTGGRGRRGAHWHSGPGLGLWMSIALRRPPGDLGFAAALAVRMAAGDLGFDPPLAVKWPNDLLAVQDGVRGRKVCGVLVEHRAGQTAVGIGVNLAHAEGDFPEDLRGSATSLALAYGRAPARDAMAARVLAAYRGHLEAVCAGRGDEVFEAWRAALGIEGRAIARDGLRGTVERVERDGALRVRTSDGTVRVDAGAVEIVEG